MAPDGPPPNYEHKSAKQLHATLATRGISHKDLKLKAQFVATAREDDILQRDWIDPKWSVFFQRDFKTDPLRDSC